MTGIAVHVRDLGKRYHIGGSRQIHDTAREWLTAAVKGPVKRVRAVLGGGGAHARTAEFWALRDVSFDVSEGEVLGVIGRNGAGKSTLLKILSRITDPTEGYAELRGRAGSLLEVGTGFHQELTGRENIFLNGSILGMGRREIDEKLDEIVSFSEIERFIDTPVKHYSSGMRVRLAFAVAAHLEPEILIIDEVLAVGDLAFQRKCLGKMDEVAGEGRTVLFVSHSMGAVRQLCARAIWLDEGRIRSSGDVAGVVDAYVRTQEVAGHGGAIRLPEDGSKPAEISQVRLLNDEGLPSENFDCDRPVTIELSYRIREEIPQLYGYLQIQHADGTPVLVSDSHDVGRNPLDRLSPGTYLARITLPRRTLAPGEYSIVPTLASPASVTTHTIDAPGALLSFTLSDNTSARGNRRQGYFSTLLRWEVEAQG